MPAWHILTGEYPPQPGGVSDYTRLVACALAAAGDEVHVWAPGKGLVPCPDAGVTVHRLSGNFGPRALGELASGLRRYGQNRRLLVQYVPHAFGYKAMNVWLPLWLKLRGRQEHIWVMFHEVCISWGWPKSFKQFILGGVTRLMARLTCRAAERAFISIPKWEALLPAPRLARQRPTWLPVPSNIHTRVDPALRQATRARLALAPGQLVIGHFGTVGGGVASLLTDPFVGLLRADVRRLGLLMGHSSKDYAEDLRRRYPDLGARLRATGSLEGGALATHLSVCDLLLQPYPDGVTTRRGSLMAGLALGLPIVTTEGFLSEPVWRTSRAVALTACQPAALAGAAEELLADGGARRQLGQRAAQFYQDCFSLEHTVHLLRNGAGAGRC
jgi:glycosyltransferase involved in cell wall biosynthesis